MSDRLQCELAKARVLARTWRGWYEQKGGEDNLRQAGDWEQKVKHLERVEAEARRVAEIVEACIG